MRVVEVEHARAGHGQRRRAPSRATCPRARRAPRERRKRRESVMQSSVWNADRRRRPSRAPRRCSNARSRAPRACRRASRSRSPSTATPAAAISSATFQPSLTWCSTTRKPNSSRSRSTVRMSSWRCVWWCTMRLPSSTSTSASIAEVARGHLRRRRRRRVRACRGTPAAFDELLAHQRRRLAARAGERRSSRGSSSCRWPSSCPPAMRAVGSGSPGRRSCCRRRSFR